MGVGLRLQAEVGGVLPAGRVRLCGNQPVSQVIASRYLGTAAMFSAQTRTRRPSDTVDRLERATPRSDHERAQIEGRLKFDFLTGTG